MLFRRHQEAAEAATWGMLLAFAAALAVLVVATNLALALAWRLTIPVAGGYPALFFETNTAVVLMLVLGGCWIETLRLREGGAYVAERAGARPAETAAHERDGASERRLVNVVHEIALAGRTRPPAAWLVPRDETINAFAAGWTPEDAVIAVTRGALERLTRAELQGLVGHEMSHLVSGDTRLHMRLIGLVWGLQMVYGLGCTLVERDERGNLHAGVIIGVVLMVVGYAGWLAGRLLQAAVARQREFHADASAVQYTRTVDGIGGALRKIAGLPPLPRPRPPESLTHLWLAEAGEAGTFRSRWLATHPPIAQRLQRLYGRPMDALDAPLLPPPADEALLAMAPPTPADAAADQPVRGAAMALTVTVKPATQDERDAMQRAALWRGRGERHAALLAWLIGDAADEASWTAWRERVGGASFIERLRSDWLTLRSAARWQVFDSLVEHTRDAGPVDRATLIRAARGLALHGAARMRLLLLRRALRGAPPSRGRRALEELGPALNAASGLLAVALGAPGAAWAAGLGRPAGSAEAGARWRAFGLRRLHAMERPRVARAWCEAAAAAALLQDCATADVLAVACRLLDSPLPPELENR
jgi:Zn-dependent protease with chaperone function